MTDVLKVDLRSKERFTEAGSPDALNIPLEELAQRGRERLAFEDKLLLVDDDADRVSAALDVLWSLGFHTADEVPGGMLAFKVEAAGEEGEEPAPSRPTM